MAVVQTSRFDDILNSRAEQGSELGMAADFVRTVLSAIHEESVRQQIEILESK